MFQEILELVNTRVQRDIFLRQLSALASELYSVGGSFEEKVGKLLTHEYAERMKGAIEKGGINTGEPASVQKFLDELKEELNKVKLVEVTLAFEPSDTLVRRVASWLESNLGEKVILDVVRERSLVAGMAINYNGVFWEHSIRKKLEAKFKNKELSALIK